MLHWFLVSAYHSEIELELLIDLSLQNEEHTVFQTLWTRE